MTETLLADPLAGARAVVSGLVAGLLDDAPRTSRKREFLRRVDRAQAELARSFFAAYPDEGFAELLALRVANLTIARYHFDHRHTVLASRPMQLMLDPINNCHLQCPGCVHSGNPALSGRFDWPGGILSPETHRRFIDEYGPFAFGVVYYNWGEPLLGKATPGLLRDAKRYLLHTCLSTNLSVPFDVDALVESGLNFLFLSIDGATQPTYEKFRRGGDLDLVYDNIRKLVEARQRLGRRTPYLLWRYLTFEHNLHEVDLAIRLARELDVDQISITTPFAVEWDDPSIRVARSEREGIHRIHPEATFKDALDDWRSGGIARDEIVRRFAEPWEKRLGVEGDEEPSRRDGGACWWLYQSTTLDARGRILSCCMAPETGHHKVYGSFSATPDGAFNTMDLRRSRLAFADPAAFAAEMAAHPGDPTPFCAHCTDNPELTYTLGRDVARDLRFLDPARLVDDALVPRLTEWPQSR